MTGTTVAALEAAMERPPTHLELPVRGPDEMLNAQEVPGSSLLTECIEPRILEVCPDEQYFIGCSVGIYFRLMQPLLAGRRAPDWFCVLGVPPMLEGRYRRSYVLWQEVIKPLLVVEFVSGDGSEERDTTPLTGKFWVYEKGICAAFYAIFDPEREVLEVYHLVAGAFVPLSPNAAGRFPIPPLGLELGIWRGKYRGLTMAWLRAWNPLTGQMIPISGELVEVASERVATIEASLEETVGKLNNETARANNEAARANDEAARANDEAARANNEAAEKAKLAAKLRELGIDPASL